MSYGIMLVITVTVILGAFLVSGAPPVVVNQYNHHNGDQYSWGYKLTDTQEANQDIQKKVLDDGQQILVFSGSYSFSGDDGIHHTVEYTADENGYHPVIDAPRQISTATSEPPPREDSSTTTARPTTMTYPFYPVSSGIDFKCLESLCGKK
nr:endocuticle structural glycoprotein SgAbd-5-like isoform X2 [Aedes albopictus]